MTKSLINTQKEVKLSLNTKKGRKILLENKITEINNRLEELGVNDLKYKLNTSVSNPETTQNTITIYNSTDINLLFRMMASYKNMLIIHNNFCKETKINKSPLVNNQGLNINDIISDLELRIVYLSNVTEINKLNQIKQELLPFRDEDSKFIDALKKVDIILKS